MTITRLFLIFLFIAVLVGLWPLIDIYVMLIITHVETHACL